MRHDRLNHAYQGDLKKNLQHFFEWQHVKADPEICQIILKDQPKKKHRVLPTSVENLLQCPSETSIPPQSPSLTSMPSKTAGHDDSFQESDNEFSDFEDEQEESVSHFF